MSQRSVLVGCTNMGRRREAYFSQFPVIEYQQSFFSPPKAAVLRKIRASAPSNFSFIVRAWQIITHNPGRRGYERVTAPISSELSCYGHLRLTDQVFAAWEATAKAALLLEAPAILLETPVDFTPTSQNRQRLATFAERIDRHDKQIIWDGRGVWSLREIERICTDLNFIPAIDPLTLSPEEIIRALLPMAETTPHLYAKVLGLGRSRPLSDDELLRLTQALTAFSQAWCIFHTQHSVPDARRLQELLP